MAPVETAEPTELIYVPSSSWAPLQLAAAIALLAAGTFMGPILWVIGGFILLLSARSWWTRANDEISRMRRDQPMDTAVIPAEPVRRK